MLHCIKIIIIHFQLFEKCFQCVTNFYPFSKNKESLSKFSIFIFIYLDYFRNYVAIKFLINNVDIFQFQHNLKNIFNLLINFLKTVLILYSQERKIIKIVFNADFACEN